MAKRKIVRKKHEAPIPSVDPEPERMAEPVPDPVIPPCPEEDPRLGDKTPAVVEWLAQYHPEEYRRRYAGRRTHLGQF